MQKHDYIEASLSLVNEGKDFDDVITNLKKVLEHKGHGKLYKSILTGLLSRIENSLQLDTALVSVAREKDLEVLKEKIKQSLSEFESKEFESKVDPSLVGGYVIEHDNKIIDNSYKSRLVSLYRSLIG